MQKKTIVVDGYYGMRNAGDDAFCLVAADYLRSVGLEPWFIGPTRKLPSANPTLSGLFPERRLFPGQGRLRAALAACSSGVVAHVGGSLFSSLDKRKLDQLRLHRLGLTRLLALGVSIGPFARQTAKEETIRALTAFDWVAVRDTASLERVRSASQDISAELTFDPAVLLPGARLADSKQTSSPTNPHIGVSACRYESLGGGTRDIQREKKRLRFVREVVSHLVVRGVSVTLFAFNTHPEFGDEPTLHELRESLPHGRRQVDLFVYNGDLVGLCRRLKYCSFVVSMRLHSGIFPYALGVPFGMIPYHAKCTDFCREIGLASDLYLDPGSNDPAAVADITLSYTQVGRRWHELPLDTAQSRARRAFEAAPWDGDHRKRR